MTGTPEQHASLDDLMGRPPSAPARAASPASATSPRTPDDPESLLTCTDLQMRTRQGSVFGPVTWDVPPATLGAVLGEQGSGRSAFLLALAGRLQGVTGGLDVGGIDGVRHPRQLRKQVAVARVTDFAELEPSLTVAEAVDERALLEGASLRDSRRTFSSIEQALGLTFPYYDRVGEISALQRTLLTAVLGSLRPSRYIVLDDVDESLTADQLRTVYDHLATLGELGHHFVVSALTTSYVPPDAARVELPPATTDDTLALRFGHLRPRRVTRAEEN